MTGPNLSFLRRPGFREGLMSAGMAMMAQSDTPGSTVLGNLGRALPAGVQAGREAATREQYDAMLDGAPPEMQQLLRMLGPREGAAFMLERAMAGAEEYTLSPGDVRFRGGEEIASVAPERDVRVIGDVAVDLSGDTPEVVYAAPQAMPDATEVGALRDDFERNILPYETSVAAYRKLEAAATGEATPQKDLALVFNYMKTIEPSSSVQQGEYATAQNSGSAFDIVGNLYNRLMNGQRLNETQRRQFLGAAREQLATQLVPYQQVADQYSGIARERRYNVAEVVRNPFVGLDLTPVAPTGTDLSDDEIMRRVLGR